MKLYKKFIAKFLCLAILVSSLVLNSTSLVDAAVDSSGRPGPTAINSAGSFLTVQEIRNRIFWLDFNNPNAVIEGLGEGDELLVGTKYSLELTPGYVVTAQVTELKPWAIDETNTYRPDAPADYAGTPARVVVRRPDMTWAHLSNAGLLESDLKNSFGSERDYGNIGFTIKVTATYNGQPVIPTIIVADGEEAKETEHQIFTTNGTPWEILANIKRSGDNLRPYDIVDGYTADVTAQAQSLPYTYTSGNYQAQTKTMTYSSYNTGFQSAFNAAPEGSPYKETYSADAFEANWQNADLVTGGIGSQVFGPVTTNMYQNSVPILQTTALSTDGVSVSTYINSAGQQTSVFGFIVKDKGDAPASYGDASHLVNPTLDNFPPYLGTVKADINVNVFETPWLDDDLIGDADEGVEQLTGNQFANVVQSGLTEYTLDVIANRNTNEVAYVKAWVDFDNNGRFDDYEGSELFTVTEDGVISLKFNDVYVTEEAAVEKLGVRVRISKYAEEILSPVGDAVTGEVEDFLVQLVQPPRGDRSETVGPKGQTQTAKVSFTAVGNLKDSDEANEIDTTVPVKIVNENGDLVDKLVVPGEGTYEVAPDGTVTFTPEPDFVGTAKGIVLRAQDKNGLTSGWASLSLGNNNDGSHSYPNRTMDAVYVPTVVPAGRVVIKYEDTNGNPIQDPVVDEDNVSVGTPYDTTDEGDKPTVIEKDGNRYVLVPSLTKGESSVEGHVPGEQGEVIDGDITITYVYKKVANWIPKLPGVPEEDYPKFPYPFDPENPTDPIDPSNPENPIPYIPGFTPIDPNTNEPLNPIDPEDPTKGYIPPVPKDSEEDTYIPYVKDEEETPKKDEETPKVDETPKPEEETETPKVDETEEPKTEETPEESKVETTVEVKVETKKEVKKPTKNPVTGDAGIGFAVTSLVLAAAGYLALNKKRK